MSEMLSNVIGAPFPEHVLKQLELRAIHNSTGYGSVPTRSNNEILFLANKSAWVKLTSSIRIKLPPEKLEAYYRALELNIADYKNEDSLAKNWILEAGTSVGDGPGINLRKGIGPDGAYGLGGTQELGYRPMPGLSTVSIDTKGTLGSLREANISFKVWNMNQLNVIEALYFRLGYSMLLEWGHTQYYSNVNREGTAGGSFTTNAYGINPFEIQRKEQVQQNIAKRAYLTSGNYDGMLGIVTNFNWSFNQDGGYDCTLKLMGLGAIIDSLKINLSYKMPNIIYQRYKTQNELLKAEQDRQAKLDAENKAKQDAKNAQTAQGLPPLPDTPKNAAEIYTNIYKTDIGSANPQNQEAFLQNISYNTAYDIDINNVNVIKDYYYKATTGGSPANSRFVDQLNELRTGLFLSPITGLRSQWQVIYASKPQPITLSGGELNTAAKFAMDESNGDNRPASPWGILGYGQYNEDDINSSSARSRFVSLFDLTIRDHRGRTFAGKRGFVTNKEVGPEEYVYDIEGYKGALDAVTNSTTTVVGIPLKLKYGAKVAGQATKDSFEVVLTYYPPAYLDADKDKEDKAIRPTRKELITALDTWFNSSRKVNIISITTVAKKIKVIGELADISIPGKPTQTTTGLGQPQINPRFVIEFTNTALIQTVLPYPAPIADPTKTPAQPAATGDTNGATNNATSVQTDSADTFASSLHAMLAAVKSEIQANTPQDPNKGVFTVPLTKLTNAFFQDGILTDLLNVSGSIPTANQPFDLKKYAKKGFNSNLMVDPAAFNQVPDVNFTDLCTGYGIRYVVKEDTNKYNYPTYIKFGYLLAFLNNMCLIYDSTQDTDKHPYVYLDFYQ